MRLYTSLVHLKLSMNNGELPPMMDVPVEVRHIIDPMFTVGLGALTEVEGHGLRCPIRGCGNFYHSLTKHANTMHRDIGGAAAIKTALSIPANARLISAKTWRKLHDRSIAQRGRRIMPSVVVSASATTARKRVSSRREASETIGAKNLRLSCERQLKHRMLDLYTTYGRSPSMNDAAAVYGPGFVGAVKRTFGSWNALKAMLNVEPHKHGNRRSSDEILESFRAWYEVNRSLPTYRQANLTRVPLLPSQSTVLRAMKTTSWAEAMRQIASLLDIYGGRYGLPIEDKPKEEEAA